MTELEGCLKERDTSANDLSLSSPIIGGDEQASVPVSVADPGIVNSANAEQALQNAEKQRIANGVAADNMKPTKRQIEQRIEEDRERHKRMRESIWVVPPNPVDQARKFFSETSDLGEDDRILGEEETSEYRLRLDRHMCRHELKRWRTSKREERERELRGMGRERERPGSNRKTNGVAQHP